MHSHTLLAAAGVLLLLLLLDQGLQPLKKKPELSHGGRWWRQFYVWQRDTVNVSLWHGRYDWDSDGDDGAGESWSS